MREENLILDVADALARRNAAEVALSEAQEVLTAALEELQRHGFQLTEIAQLLEVDPGDITGTGPSRRAIGRTTRPPSDTETVPLNDTEG